MRTGDTLDTLGIQLHEPSKKPMKRLSALFTLILCSLQATSADEYPLDIPAELHRRAATGFYDLTEVVSSGITSSRDRSFATLEFDTIVDDPQVRVRIHLGDGTIRDDQTVLLSQLTPQ